MFEFQILALIIDVCGEIIKDHKFSQPLNEKNQKLSCLKKSIKSLAAQIFLLFKSKEIK